jgi:peroxiredoxin Q/BCP
MASGPDVGDPAPDFELESTRGTVRLSERLEQGPVLLVFYPGDDTTVCTKQLCDYKDNLDVFSDVGVQVLAINPASLESHEAFSRKHGLPFPLLADPHRKACKPWGATGLLGMTRRALFLVGADGRVRYRRVDLPIFRTTAAELEEVIAGLEL